MSGLRVLSLDGGGISVLSELTIIRELMARIQSEKGLLTIPRPCDWFHLIGGTGTGGLVAILLGRLKLTIEEAIACSLEVLRTVFARQKWYPSGGAFSASELEQVLSRMVEKYSGRPDARMIEPHDTAQECKVVVYALAATAIRAGIATSIRTYRVGSNQGPDCTIVEAVRATMATPGIFKPKIITELGVDVKYIGGDLGCNNPTIQLLDEIGLLYPGLSISCMVSIGSGQTHSACVSESRRYHRSLPAQLSITIRNIAMDCEKTNQEAYKRFEGAAGVYYRFNVEHGMQDINQSNSNQFSEAHSHTLNYIKDASINARMKNATSAIIANKGSFAIMGGSRTTVPQRRAIGRIPPLSQVFTGREDVIEIQRAYFYDQSLRRHVFVLYGIGGAGKTQLALAFVHQYKELFWDVFFIDASSHSTIEARLAQLAKNAGLEADEDDTSGSKAALDWLIQHEERWLLIFDNADDPLVDLRAYFPICDHGDILITTRNQSMLVYTHGNNSYYHVQDMNTDDARDLLLKSSGANDEGGCAARLVEMFGHLALAIVQAGAYMRATKCGVAKYTELFQQSRDHILREPGIGQTLEYHRSVYTTFDLNIKHIDERARELLRYMSFMHHRNIPETIFKNASDGILSFKPEIPLTEAELAIRRRTEDFLAGFRTASNTWDSWAFQKLVDSLNFFSLLDYDPVSRTYSMHPLIHSWCRSIVDDAATIFGCATWILILLLPGSGLPVVREPWKPHPCAYIGPGVHEVLLGLAHTKALLQANKDLIIAPALVLHLAGFGRFTLQQPKNWEKHILYALQASRERLGIGHLSTLILMYCAAVTHHLHGQLEEADNLLGRLVEIVEQKYEDTCVIATILLAVIGGIQARRQEIEVESALLGMISEHMGIDGTQFFLAGQTAESLDSDATSIFFAPDMIQGLLRLCDWMQSANGDLQKLMQPIE